MAWLRDHVPQMSGALQVGLPLLWGRSALLPLIKAP
jgi:hypothetical protein